MTFSLTKHGSMPPSLGGASTSELEANDIEGPRSCTSDISAAVGANLRRLRVRRGLSLDRLAQASGVSRAMLSQIERGRSTPTINVVWKIARAFEVSFSTLISTRPETKTTVLYAAHAKHLSNTSGQFTSRALFPFDRARRVEFYELRLSSLSTETADPHPPGTVENLVVAAGTVDIDIDGERHSLSTGDAILFDADVSHAYRNSGHAVAVMYLVMTYAEAIG